jgi:CBS domain containing-hemolysin-like protein
MRSPGVIGLLLLLLASCAVACYSLREFSYSRLEELCQRLGRPERFRAILERRNSTLLVLEFGKTASLLAIAVVLCWTIGLQMIAVGPNHADFPWLVSEFAAIVLLALVAADLVPWLVSRVASERVLFVFWPALSLIRQAGLPLIAAARVLDLWSHRLTGRGSPEEVDAKVIGDEIRSVVDEGAREGVIESDAGQMIHRVMELQHEDVAAIMTPRTEMFCVDVESSLEEARQKLIEAGHSRVPVIGESTDDILGLLYAKDFLKALAPHQAGELIPVLRDLLREPLYIPVTTQIPALLELMKRKKVHIAIVLDEYGGVAGLVTMEDILEEIVGEIADEFDDAEHLEQIRIVSPTVAEVDARVHIDDLNERLHYGLPEDGEFDTIGGFVFSQLGRVPTVGEVVSWKHLKMTVLTADRRKIARLRIEAQPESVAETAASSSEA